MEFKAWEQSRRIEQQYQQALRKLRRYILDYIGDDADPASIIYKLNMLGSKRELQQWAAAVAHRMVTNTLDENSRTWRDAARAAGKGRWLYENMQITLNGHVGATVREMIDSNAQYISTVPQSVAKDLTRFVSTKTFADNRFAYKAPEFREMVGDMTENHAKLIARTETAKAHAAINQAQAEELGLDWYIWRSSRDIATRDSHRFMNGVLCRYSDPPSPEVLSGKGKPAGNYHPGNIYNCRCFASEVFSLKNISWPARVCINNKIDNIGKREFLEKFGDIP